MSSRTVVIRPGPKALSAALKLAGFSETSYYPAVTDACGVKWPKPSGLQIMLAIVGGESSGNAAAWHVNADASVDFGLCMINNSAHPEYFSQPVTAGGWNWLDYLSSAQAAYAIHAAADYGWGPWNAYSGGGFKAERYKGKSWLSWADFGISAMLTSTAALVKAGKTEAQALAQVASVDNDPLIYS